MTSRVFLIALGLVFTLSGSSPVYSATTCPPFTYPQSLAALLSRGPIEKLVTLEHLRVKYPHLNFREARFDDKRRLNEFIDRIRSDFFPDVKKVSNAIDRDIASIESSFLTPRSALIVVEDAEKNIVGTAGFAETGTNTVEMRKIYVDPSMRGTGLGNELILSVIDLSKRMGHEQMWLTTVPQMKKAVELYHGYGFTHFVPKNLPSTADPTYIYMNLDLKK